MTKISLINPSIGQSSKSHPKIQELNIEQGKFMQKTYEKFYEKLDHKILRIDKVQKEHYFLSNGLLSIASILEKNGFNVEYLQQDYLEKENRWNTALQNTKTSEIVGITSQTGNSPNSLKIGRTIKKLNPEVFIVYGGPDPTFRYDLYLNFADSVVLGEGEETMLEIAQSNNGTARKMVRGTIVKDGYRLRNNGLRVPANISELPPPAFHLVEEKLRKSSGLYLLTSRGCAFRCAYCSECSFFGEKARFRNTEAILKDINALRENFEYENTFLHFADSTFTLRSKKEMTELTQALRKNFDDMIFNCNIRSATVDREMFDMLSSAGFFGFIMGLESGSDFVLEKMNKGETYSDYLRFLKRIKGKIAIVETHWIFGFPGENHQTAEDSISKMIFLLKEGLITAAWPKIFVPYPGSEVYRFPKRYGLQIVEGDLSKHSRFAPPLYTTSNLSSDDLFLFWLKAVDSIIELCRQRN